MKVSSPAGPRAAASFKARVQGQHDCSLLRYTTQDFVQYSEPHTALVLDDCSGTPTMKSIARSPEGLYVMFTVGGPPPGLGTYTSRDAGMSWKKADTTGVRPPDKDDLNIVYSHGRFVDMQIVWQNWTLKYCDNGGCDRRRVVSTKLSSDGAAWSADGPYITPDEQDPPELQFYRTRPFYIGNTSRLMSHTLLYAPAPPQSVVGPGYGRHPSMCIKSTGFCHGPHMYEEWWVGPASGDAADTRGWRRPYRRTHAAPRDAFLMAPPVAHGDELLWVGSVGSVFTLPLYRIAGIFAPANGEFSTPAFTVPKTPMWLNADAPWHSKLRTVYDGVQGCDEGCAAYVFATVLDAATGHELAGYGVGQAIVMTNTSGLRLPLRWHATGGNGTVDTAAIVGRSVRLRLYFRDATVYAVGAGDE